MRKNVTIVTMFLSCCLVNSLNAQNVPVQQKEVQEKITKEKEVQDKLSKEEQQRLGRLMSNLQKSVRRDYAADLEIIGSQREKLVELNKEFRGWIMKAMNESDDVNRMEALQKADRKILSMEDRFEKILLPHQLRRLNQISNRTYHLSASAETYGLLSPLLMKNLEIDEKQAAEIRTAAEKANENAKIEIAELEKKIERVRAEAREKVLGELSKKQLEKYKQTMGESFKLDRFRGQKKSD